MTGSCAWVQSTGTFAVESCVPITRTTITAAKQTIAQTVRSKAEGLLIVRHHRLYTAPPRLK